jgi:CubicO group peptidase (beta-lactamase class C family)
MRRARFFRYSDINYVLLGQLVQRVSGMPLDQFARSRIYDAAAHAGHRLPAAAARRRRRAIAPTQLGARPGTVTAHADLAPGQVLQGVVHDPTARRMDGVAGSAGVFTTAHDVARYARMLLNGGELDGVRILQPGSVRLMTTVQSPPGMALRGLGMDIDSPYAARPRGERYPARQLRPYRLYRLRAVDRSGIAQLLCAAVEPGVSGRCQPRAGAVYAPGNAGGGVGRESTDSLKSSSGLRTWKCVFYSLRSVSSRLPCAPDVVRPLNFVSLAISS